MSHRRRAIVFARDRVRLRQEAADRAERERLEQIELQQKQLNDAVDLERFETFRREWESGPSFAEAIASSQAADDLRWMGTDTISEEQRQDLIRNGWLQRVTTPAPAVSASSREELERANDAATDQRPGRGWVNTLPPLREPTDTERDVAALIRSRSHITRSDLSTRVDLTLRRNGWFSNSRQEDTLVCAIADVTVEQASRLAQSYLDHVTSFPVTDPALEPIGYRLPSTPSNRDRVRLLDESARLIRDTLVTQPLTGSNESAAMPSVSPAPARSRGTAVITGQDGETYRIPVSDLQIARANAGATTITGVDGTNSSTTSLSIQRAEVVLSQASLKFPMWSLPAQVVVDVRQTARSPADGDVVLTVADADLAARGSAYNQNIVNTWRRWYNSAPVCDLFGAIDGPANESSCIRAYFVGTLVGVFRDESHRFTVLTIRLWRFNAESRSTIRGFNELSTRQPTPSAIAAASTAGWAVQSAELLKEVTPVLRSLAAAR